MTIEMQAMFAKLAADPTQSVPSLAESWPSSAPNPDPGSHQCEALIGPFVRPNFPDQLTVKHCSGRTRSSAEFQVELEHS